MCQKLTSSRSRLARRIFLPSVVLGLLVWTFAMSATQSRAALMITGDITLITPPTSVVLNALTSNTEIFLFPERQNLVLSSDLLVDITSPGTYVAPVTAGAISAGTTINSFFLHFDTVASTSAEISPPPVSSVTFMNPILGIIVFDATLDASDPIAGLGAVAYPTGLTNRGLELGAPNFDQVTLSADLRTLTIDRLRVSTVHDQIRVITTPEPSTFVLLTLGLLFLARFSASRVLKNGS